MNVLKQVGASPHKTTWRNYKRAPYPFFDYWAKQAKWDSTTRALLLASGLYAAISPALGLGAALLQFC